MEEVREERELSQKEFEENLSETLIAIARGEIDLDELDCEMN